MHGTKGAEQKMVARMEKRTQQLSSGYFKHKQGIHLKIAGSGSIFGTVGMVLADTRADSNDVGAYS